MSDDTTRNLYQRHATTLEDFWGRRDHSPRFAREFEVFGRRCLLFANDERVLQSVDVALPLYSRVPSQPGRDFRLQVAVRNMEVPAGLAVDDAPGYMRYAGEGGWIYIGVGPFGSAWADLGAGRGTAVIDPSLAARPDLFALCLLNTLLLNFCLADGYAMLHASCLMRDERALLLMAPHNTGKSTTALRLALHGFALVSDSMVHVVPELPRPARPLLAGFPVRRIKLRSDMAPLFEHLDVALTVERVRGEVKYVLDLERVDRSAVRTDAVRPHHVTLCLLGRGDGDESHWEMIPHADIWTAVVENSLYYDSWPVWERNLASLQHLLRDASCARLTIGRDPVHLLATVEALWARGTPVQGAG